MKIKNALAMVTALAALPLATQAGITPDASITAIFGGGNPDNGWYESSDNGINIGARIKERYGSVVASSGNNYAPGGVTWNAEFSFDVTGTGFTLASSGYSYWVSVDGGTAVDLTGSIFFPDNAYGITSTVNGGGSEGLFATYAANNTIMQNSEPSSYILLAGANGDANAYHTFDFFVTDAQGNTLNSDTITVNAVPEPSTYIAAALLLLPLGISSARILRRRSAVKA